MRVEVARDVYLLGNQVVCLIFPWLGLVVLWWGVRGSCGRLEMSHPGKELVSRGDKMVQLWDWLRG